MLGLFFENVLTQKEAVSKAQLEINLNWWQLIVFCDKLTLFWDFQFSEKLI